MGFFSSLFGCGHSNGKRIPDILSNSEEGFADLTFLIVEVARNRDGSQRLVANARHRDRAVGLAVRLGPNWREGTLGDTIVTHQGEVTLASIGEDSDALVTAVSQIYELESGPLSMAEAVDFTGISLEGDPARLSAGPVKIKLFFEHEDEEQYAEVYLNIDLQQMILEVREKDQEYRGALLRALRRG